MPVAEREALSNGYLKADANGALNSFMDEIKTQNHPSLYQRHDEIGAGTPLSMKASDLNTNTYI